MGWADWFRRRGETNGRGREWRKAWMEAIATPDRGRLQALRDQLTGMDLDDEDLEIEREMLEGLEALVELSDAVAAGGPPTIVTGHRAVGSDPCFFSAPASLPDDPAQPSGTLLLTKTRAVFVGGARAVTIPWHSVSACTQQDRDVLLARADRDDLHRLRLNSFGDTLRAAFLARHFSRRRV